MTAHDFEHRGYLGTQELCPGGVRYQGRILGIEQTIMYYGDNLIELGRKFIDKVDEYAGPQTEETQ